MKRVTHSALPHSLLPQERPLSRIPEDRGASRRTAVPILVGQEHRLSLSGTTPFHWEEHPARESPDGLLHWQPMVTVLSRSVAACYAVAHHQDGGSNFL